MNKGSVINRWLEKIKMENKMLRHPKLKEEIECAFPERKICNYDSKCDRCVYMKYNNSKSILDPTRWECTFKKDNGKKKKP